MIDYIEEREFAEENGGPFEGEWVRDLGEAVEKYNESGDNVSCMRVLFEIMEGLLHGESVPVPAKFSGDEDDPVAVMTVEMSDMNFLLVQPVLNADYETYASMKLARVMYNVLNHDDRYDGIAFGGREDSGFILPVALIASMLALYCIDPRKKTDDYEEPEPEEEPFEGTAFNITAMRPMSEASFAALAQAILGLMDRTGEHVCVEFRNVLDDGLIFMQAYTKGEKMHVELAFDMSDFDWEHPLILANDEMNREQAVEFFKKICAESILTDDMKIVQNSFRNITEDVFGEEG